MISTDWFNGSEISQHLITFRNWINSNVVKNILCYENDDSKYIQFLFLK